MNRSAVARFGDWVEKLHHAGLGREPIALAARRILARLASARDKGCRRFGDGNEYRWRADATRAKFDYRHRRDDAIKSLAKAVELWGEAVARNHPRAEIEGFECAITQCEKLIDKIELPGMEPYQMGGDGRHVAHERQYHGDYDYVADVYDRLQRDMGSL